MDEIKTTGTERTVIARCPLCGEKDACRDFKAFDRLHGRPGVFTAAKCSGCSSLYLKDVPRDLGAYYPEGKYYSTYESNTHELRTKKKIIELYYSGKRGRGLTYYLLYPLKGRVQGIPDFIPGGRVLDVGCGSGLILDLLKSAGWETHGIDTSASAIGLIRKKGHEGVCGELRSGLYRSGHFDAVVMSHSIEHVKDPLAYLRLASEKLKPGGQLVLVAPNAGSLGFRLFGKAWTHIDAPRHVYVPSVPGMTAMLRKAGFSVESVVYTGCNWSQSLDYLFNGRHTPGSFFYRPFVKTPLEALAQALNLLRLGDFFQIKARKTGTDAP